ncbi:hypothetical protein EGJ03_09385 [Stenotrophomonas maltophilia]|nr:hypothetical protein EGJ06_03480 [Stenotrophomonas maltophilia]RRU13710.1 hypothetical protein EGJ77_03455 [Stenotrophomonas maltophilia]RRU32095.1 hypothetical protein EGJ03_09385 [Stenotrophomonas maltophilia]RRU99537.1 hypothetical protein EGI91_04335 [Stenotrophomonas maltophilia]
MSGPEAEANRFVSVRFKLGEEVLLFRRIVGDQLFCLTPDDNDLFRIEKVVGIYYVWGAVPEIYEYWGTVRFEFNSWRSFAREQTWRIARGVYRCRHFWWRLRLRVRAARKRVSIQRYSVLSTVKRLKTGNSVPTAWDVANSILGQDWTNEQGAFERLDQVEEMLEALVDLKELRKKNAGYVVTGSGIAALSQYEEEERKHRESIWMQRWIAILTVVMVVAALLQAKVIEIPPMLTFKGKWPWQ